MDICRHKPLLLGDAPAILTLNNPLKNNEVVGYMKLCTLCELVYWEKAEPPKVVEPTKEEVKKVEEPISAPTPQPKRSSRKKPKKD